MSYEAEWTNEVVGYAANYFRKHEWRIKPMMEVDDMMQEAYLIFLRLLDRYEYDSPQHFMAIWKLALRNAVHWWSGRRTRRHEVAIPDDFDMVGKDVDASIRLERRMAQVSGPMRNLLDGLRGRGRRPRRKGPGGRRLTTNEYLCRYAGVPDEVPMRKMLDDFLKDCA
jgi:DNA-directed RNA polymerase specialized sigma24 family protein